MIQSMTGYGKAEIQFENKNYIPDRLERMFGKDPSAKKGKEQNKKGKKVSK